jgi:type II secretory pathway component PulC
VAPSGTGDAIHVDRAALERDLAGVESVGEVIGLRPHITWKGIDGITVHHLPPDSPIANVGLQQGDVVHTVNGRSLTSIDAAWSLGEVLQNADVLEGEVTRDGVRQRIVVHLD